MTRKLAVLGMALVACALGVLIAKMFGPHAKSDEVLRIIALMATVAGFGVLVYGMRRASRGNGLN
jgi:hypothetical protein